MICLNCGGDYEKCNCLPIKTLKNALNDLYCSKCKSNHHPAVDCVKESMDDKLTKVLEQLVLWQNKDTSVEAKVAYTLSAIKKIYDGRLNKEKIKKVSWKAIPDVHEEVNEYELRADNGDYSPNEHERMLMEDFTHGLVEEIVDKVTQALVDYWKGKI